MPVNPSYSVSIEQQMESRRTLAPVDGEGALAGSVSEKRRSEAAET